MAEPNWQSLGTKSIDITVKAANVEEPTLNLSLDKTTAYPDETVTVTVDITNPNANYDATDGEVVIYANVNNALATIADKTGITVPKGSSSKLTATFTPQDIGMITNGIIKNATIYALAKFTVGGNTFDSIKSNEVTFTMKLYQITVSTPSFTLLKNGQPFSGGDVYDTDTLGTEVSYAVNTPKANIPAQGSTKFETVVKDGSGNTVYDQSTTKGYSDVTSPKSDKLTLAIGKLNPGSYSIDMTLYYAYEVVS